MTAATKNLRFWDNNFLDQRAIDGGRLTFSSETVGFEFNNVFNSFRSKNWVPAGNFDIDATNNLIYFNDGGNKTATLTVASYTGTTLATEIQTQMNSVGSGWSVSYTAEFQFRLTNAGSFTLQYATLTNSVWDTIGHDFLLNATGTSFFEKNIRRHTSEYFLLDAGISQKLNAFAAIGDISIPFSLSNTAVIKIEGNNVNNFDAAPLSETITRDDKGLFIFSDSLPNTNFRYWRWQFIDRESTEDIKIGNIYLGDFTTTVNSNVGSGLSKTQVDPSTAQESERGARFFEKRTKYHKISGNTYDVIFEGDRLLIEALYDKKGISDPFFISIDPTAAVSPSLKEFTYFVTFDKAPIFKNLFRDKWTVSLDFREVIS